MAGRPGGHEGASRHAPASGNGTASRHGTVAAVASVRPLWWAVSALLVAAAVVVALTRRHELVTAVHLIDDVRLPRLLVAAGFEAASLACLAAVQHWLLRAGGARIRLRVVGAVVLAANAIAGALPGGAAFAAAWVFRQFRRRGAGQVLAGTVLVVAGLLSGLSLFVLLMAGVLAAGSSGPVAGVRPVVIGLAVVAVLVVGLAAGLFRFPRVRRKARRVWRRIGLRSRRLWDIEQALSHLVRQVRTTRPGIRPWLWPSSLAVLNWGFDLACLVACVWSLGIAVPWHGVLAAYALTQFAGSLRLTPGGLGVVETSLTALLVLYGLSAEQAIAVTLLYRVLSYWVLQPVGWASGLGLTLSRGHAGPDADTGSDTGSNTGSDTGSAPEPASKPVSEPVSDKGPKGPDDDSSPDSRA
ncbi:lysylphosphatidylglycerol synthase transmembrane domain-containing protein [Streptomyces scopuliridis]|uniref:lysylphosphatidylglycerol synthase transmembrane domain-containing protein n=1 Tax=Streptomyces scopuliridis TaxID=452529 RepID=UPI0035DED903